jgi:hypothetical protein
LPARRRATVALPHEARRAQVESPRSIGVGMTGLLEFPALLGALLAMSAAVVLSVLPFAVLSYGFAQELPERTRQITETVAVRVGGVHGLILALVFAEAQATHTDLQQQLSKEATTMEHIALHLDQWNGPEEDMLRDQLKAYVTAILQSEWQVHAKLAGSAATKRAYDRLDIGILDLKAQTPRQESLRSRMVADMDSLQDLRRERLSLFHRNLPSLFWWVAVSGFMITVGLFFVFSATPLHIAVLSLYGAYTGLVLYFTVALSHPYTGPAAIDPSPYQFVLQDLQTDSQRTAAP